MIGNDQILSGCFDRRCQQILADEKEMNSIEIKSNYNAGENLEKKNRKELKQVAFDYTDKQPSKSGE